MKLKKIRLSKKIRLRIFMALILILIIISSVGAYFFVYLADRYSTNLFPVPITAQKSQLPDPKLVSVSALDIPLLLFPANYDAILASLGVNLSAEQKSALLRYGKVMFKPGDFNKTFTAVKKAKLPIVLNDQLSQYYLQANIQALRANLDANRQGRYITILNAVSKDQAGKLQRTSDTKVKVVIQKNIDLINQALQTPDLLNPVFAAANYDLAKQADLASLVLVADSLKQTHSDKLWNEYAFLSSIIDSSQKLFDFAMVDSFVRQNFPSMVKTETLAEGILGDNTMKLSDKVATYSSGLTSFAGLANTLTTQAIATAKASLNPQSKKLQALSYVYNFIGGAGTNLALSPLPVDDFGDNIFLNINAGQFKNYYTFVEDLAKAVNDNSELVNDNSNAIVANLRNYVESLSSTDKAKVNTVFKLMQGFLANLPADQEKVFLLAGFKIGDTPTLTVTPTIIPTKLSDQLTKDVKANFAIDYSEAAIISPNISNDNFNEAYDYSPVAQGGGVRIPILMYHQIAPLTGSMLADAYYVSPAQFEQQMAYLVQKNYKTLSVQEYADQLQSWSNPTQKSVLITFDDGNLNNYTTAFPILKKYGLKASFNIVTGSLWMNEDQIKDLSNSGMDIESHTVSHRDMTKLPVSDQAYQASASKSYLESVTGKSVIALIYPYCAANSDTIGVTAYYGYTLGISCGGSIDNYWSNRYALSRMQIFDDYENFKKRLSGILEAPAGFPINY